MKNLFDFTHYKAYLLEVESSRKAFQRGFRSKLAESIGCRSGYISHVLNGTADFSLEQSIRIAKFLDLKPKEQKYFLLLVEFDRAGTSDLKTHFEQEIKSLKEEYLNIKGRVGASVLLSESEQSRYYSSWHYLAVHVLSSLPDYSDARSIAEGLRLSEEVVGRILLFLIQTGIMKETKGVLKPGLTQVHLNRDSPLIRQHHTNWRIAAIQSLASEDKSDIHYSTVSTLSKADVERLKIEMTKLIENYVAIVQPSREETMYGFNLDFYNLMVK